MSPWDAVVGYPLLSSGLCLGTGIIVHQALPAQNSLCHVQLMCTMTERHMGSRDTWADTPARCWEEAL